MLSVAQVRTFLAVARHHNFTRAAEELTLAQSSVSYQVHELERTLKVRLVEIAGRRVYLTDAGQRLFTRGTALLGDLTDLEEEMHDYGAGVAGHLRLGATRTVGGYALPEVLASFRQAWPSIEVNLTVQNLQAVERMLLERTLDLAVVEWPVGSPALVSEPVREDVLVLIAPSDHPLVTRTVVVPSDLGGQTFVLREPGSGMRALSDQVLGPLGHAIVPAMEFDQPEALVRAVAAGMGLALTSRQTAVDQVAAGRVCTLPLPGVDLVQTFSLVALRGRTASPGMYRFREFLRTFWKGG
jgi:DNA-binding transcriptional LysR family regulator